MVERINIAFMYDVPNWAFHNIAKNISAQAGSDYRISSFGREDWFGKRHKLIEILKANDIVVFLWRFDFLAAVDMLFNGTGKKRKAEQYRLFSETVFITIVYDHLYYTKDDLLKHGNPFEISDIVATCSSKLNELYSSLDHLPSPSHVLIDGVETKHFDRTRNEENSVTSDEKPLVFGWVGNSKWGNTVGADMKGLNSIALPAVERLRSLGHDFEFKVADSVTSPVPKAQMPSYYSSIDVLICTSKIEGTPNPILESMASGCAFISTDVGVVREVSGPLQHQAIMAERAVDELCEQMLYAINNPDWVVKLKAENYERRLGLDWRVRFEDWERLFKEALSLRATPEFQKSKNDKIILIKRKGRTLVGMLRKWVAGSKTLYWAYKIALRYTPNFIRKVKELVLGN